MGKVVIEKVIHDKYGECVNISNGQVVLLVPLEFGPRIMQFSLAGGRNVFCEDDTMKMPVGDKEWKLRGGHRLWHSPEVFPRTYEPDSPVRLRKLKNGIRITAEPDPMTQITKEMDIFVRPDTSNVDVTHRIFNMGVWPIKLGVWALSAMDVGGVEIVPLPDRKKHESDLFTAYCNLSLWSYTKMNDKRFSIGEKYMMLRQASEVEGNFKIGISNEQGWAAYINKGDLFVKRFDVCPGAEYTDRGVNYETYTNKIMLEMESLSPYLQVSPGCSVEHAESWSLTGGVGKAPADEAEAEKLVEKYILK